MKENHKNNNDRDDNPNGLACKWWWVDKAGSAQYHR